MIEPRVWSKDGVGHIEVPMPTEVIFCVSCGMALYWRWLLVEGPEIAAWLAFCDNAACQRGPQVIRDLRSVD